MKPENTHPGSPDSSGLNRHDDIGPGHQVGLSHLRQDLKQGLRLLLKNPGFAALALLTLALGIGATTAIFSVLYGVLFQPLPFREPDQIVRVWQALRAHGANQVGMTELQFLRLRDNNRSFSQIGAYMDDPVTVTDRTHSERVDAVSASSGVLEVMEVKPLMGRILNREDEVQNGPQVTVLTYEFWQRWFHGDSNVVGQVLRINGQPVTVVGVLPGSFLLPDDYFSGEHVQMWRPLRLNVSAPDWDNYYLGAMGRLKSGVRREAAQTELNTLFRSVYEEHPFASGNLQSIGWDLWIIRLSDDLVGDVRKGLWILAGAVAVVLLIVCANVGSLLLARAAKRDKEIAVRVALGAAPLRVVLQLLAESLVLSLLGGILGLVLAWGCLKLVVPLGAFEVPRLGAVTLNFPVLVFALGVCIIAALIFGLVPAIQAARPNPNQSLRDEGRGVSAGAKRNRIHRLLVIGEVASALVLVVCAGLLLRSMQQILAVDLGFDTHNLVCAQVSLPPAHYGEIEKVNSFATQLLTRVRALPGVRSAAVTSSSPVVGFLTNTSFEIEGRSGDRSLSQHLNILRVTPDYFATIGVPLIKGRFLRESDNAEGAPVALINETMARTYWPNEDPISKHFHLIWTPPKTGPWIEVVGVVKNEITRTPDSSNGFEFNKEPKAQIYMALAQGKQIGPWQFGTVLVVRTASVPGTLAPAIRDQISTLDPEVALAETRTGDQLLELTVTQPYFDLVLLGIFAGLALVLAVIGIYGILFNIVRQRTREIGIRLALGASPASVFRLVVGQGMMLTGIGMLIGIVCSLLAARLLRTLLYGVKPIDPVTFGGTVLVLTIFAFLACFLPARRAMTVDPMIALRYE